MPDSFSEFTLSKYRATALLGKGGFGTVYRATDTTLDREVALKVLHAQLVVDDDFVRRFKNEAKAIASLRHPNIVGVYELGEDNGRWFIAMEYMSGGTLADRLARGPLPFAEAAAVLRQVCAGLETAHADGIIHRDLKPANILFDTQGKAVVSDFGLMRAAQLSSGQASSSSGAVGTPFYKAPELWRGNPPASPATDVYALGCILYEMLTGRVLFSGNTPDEILTKHLIDGPEFGADWPPTSAPTSIASVVDEALVDEIERRIPTARKLAEAVDAKQKAEQPQAAPQHPMPLTRSSNGMPGWGWLLVGGLVVIVVWALWPRAPQVVEFPVTVEVPVTIEITALATAKAPAITARPTSTPAPTSTKKSARTPPPTTTFVPTYAPSLGTISTRTREGDGMVEVYVPAGEFLMGSDKAQDKDAQDDELPQHTVYLDAFWIDQTEVTNAMFAQFVAETNYQTDGEKNGSGFLFNPSTMNWEDTQGVNWQHPRDPASDLNGLDQHPVVQVSWNDATAYCQWAGAQLPSEAQWEKAARGTDGRIYPWGNQSVAGNLLNFADVNLAVGWADKSVNDGYEFTAPVGSYPAGQSPYGALDMAGNVWEWMADWYSGTYYQDSPTNNPTGPASGDYPVLRDGSWYNETLYARTAHRNTNSSDLRNDFLGFRCLRPSP